MPPWPMSSRISSCGKAAATSRRGGGMGLEDGASPVSVGMDAWASRHLGQRPCGASAEIGAPHFGQCFSSDVSLIPVPEAHNTRGYTVFVPWEDKGERFERYGCADTDASYSARFCSRPSAGLITSIKCRR